MPQPKRSKKISATSSRSQPKKVPPRQVQGSKGTSGADQKKKGKTKRKLGEDEVAIDQELRDALEEIGTKRKSIRPEVLVDYDVLLECEGVTTRARDNASTAELAEAAHKALLAACESLGKNQPIGEALLAAPVEKDGLLIYEGLYVNARTPKLLDYQLSEDHFKRRRRSVLQEIEKYLKQPATKEQATHFGFDRAMESLQSVMHATSQLQAVCLAYLFVKALSKESAAHRTIYGRHFIGDALYNTYIDLIMCDGYILNDNERLEHKNLILHIPSQSVSGLATAVARTLDLLPLNAQERETMVKEHIAGFPQLSDYRSSRAPYDFYWLPWTEKYIRFDGDDDDSRLQHIVKACDWLAKLARAWYTPDRYGPLALNLACQVVADCYGVPDHAAMIGDMPLRDCVDYFIKRRTLPPQIGP